MDEEILDSYKNVIKALADFLGPNIEIVLHAITNDKSDIIAIENGHITGRKVGDSLTEAGKVIIKKLENGLDYFGPYKSFSPKRKNLRSITIAIRNKNGKLIGLLCLNMDLTNFENILKFVDNFLKFRSDNKEIFIKQVKKHSLEEIFTETYSTVSSKFANGRVDNFSLIKYLYEDNFFTFKNAVPYVASKLNISIYTVYSYLRKLKKEVWE